MRLIDADVLIDGIQWARQEIRNNCENERIPARAAVVMLDVLDVFENAVQEMPVIKIHIHDRGDKK